MGVALIKLTGSVDNIKVQEVYYKDGKANPPVKGCKHGGMIMVGDYVYLDEDDSGRPYCLEVMTGKKLWQREKRGGKGGCPGDNSASIAYADGNLDIRYQTGHLALVEATPAGFKEKGWFKIPNDKGPSWSHPVVVGGKLYLRTQDQLLCYDVSAAK
jgi:outer membrane protein assembly factor BamB